MRRTAEQADLDAVKKQREEEYKYMPASYRLLAELQDILAIPDAADKIEELIKAMMDEREYDRSSDREYD